ncbi:protein Z, vitamin K-dependent plasma glycoprotein a [Solea solea]|uniref:protein Z, vitamin K-dependent plasma glycoprotein a n=1 Tax=Solea solea TaxID=90069 RepID=UPI00272D62AE|nr:protein Z, vitamin K-dependent plasma glycoprotein a [Solea solea]
MGSSSTSAALLCLLVGTVAAVQVPHTVFLDKQQASAVISRQKRAVDDSNPSQYSNLEQACMERVCSYDEAKKFFDDTYRTDIFWSVYVDGDQCAEKPCKNGALCSDSVGGYDCVCKAGFTGVHCENDQTLCTLEKNKGCSQFCKPSYMSYQCSCAHGWKLSRDRNKCEPAVSYACGKVNSLRQWDDRQQLNQKNNYEGLNCMSSECPWQALLKTSDSAGFCSGVILKENLVLTSAQCGKKHATFQVAVGKVRTDNEEGEQTLHVELVHVHPRYVEGRPENDLAVVQLRDRIVFKKGVIAACLPEKDFAERVLMTGQSPAVITGWKESKQEVSALQGPLILNHLAYKQLPQCVETHPNLITNKMGCTVPQTNADCAMSPGSPLLTLHREVFFLTGVVSQPPGAECSKGYIFQKVSRYSGWLQSLMGTR